MALSANIQNKSSVTCHIGTEITMGTATLTGGTWNTAPLIDFSFSDETAPLTVAPFRTDSFAQGTSGVKHLNEDKTYEISLTMKGTAATIDRICLALFGDGTSPNALLGSSPGVTKYKDSVANAVPVTLLFNEGGRTDNDIWFTSCMCTSMELTYGIDSDGGMLKCVANFMTGYKPTEGSLTATSPTDMGNAVAFNIHDLTTHTLNAQDLLIKDYSLNISRTVTKGISDPDSSYKPLSYAISGYEVTGNITCKRDDKAKAAITTASAGTALSITDGTFAISATKCLVDNATSDIAENGFMMSIPYRCFYDDAAKTNPVVTITTA